MIDISSWEYYYKIDPIYKSLGASNMLYTPFVSPNKDMMCMSWDINSPYQKNGDERLTIELMEFFFEREVKHLDIFKDYPWAPKIYDIDISNMKIVIEWNNGTVNDILYGNGRDLDNDYPGWQEQMFCILKDIVDAGYYKMALYPHCFFFDQDNRMKTFDFYSCLSREERYLEKKKIAGMLGKQSAPRFDEATTDGIVDFEIFFKRTLSTHLKWPGDPLPAFYKRIFND